MDLNEILRFRVNRTDKARLARIARAERRDLSDLARLMLEDYIAEREKALRLPAITAAEVNSLLDPAEVNVKTGAARAPQRRVNRN